MFVLTDKYLDNSLTDMPKLSKMASYIESTECIIFKDSISSITSFFVKIILLLHLTKFSSIASISRVLRLFFPAEP